MTNALVKVGHCTVLKGEVNFPMYEQMKQKAKELSEHLQSVIVTEDTLQSSKKLVASVRKEVNELEDYRKAIKKLILEPYNDFESKVREITGIVEQSEETIRTQIKAFDEAQREEKYQLIVNEWERMTSPLDYPELFHIEDYYKPQYCNKSTSWKTIQSTMSDFIRARLKDIETIKEHYNNEYLEDYLKTGNLAETITNISKRKEAIERLSKVELEEDSFTVQREPMARFVIKGKANINLTERLLNEQGIDYYKEEI